MSEKKGGRLDIAGLLAKAETGRNPRKNQIGRKKGNSRRGRWLWGRTSRHQPHQGAWESTRRMMQRFGSWPRRFELGDRVIVRLDEDRSFRGRVEFVERGGNIHHVLPDRPADLPEDLTPVTIEVPKDRLFHDTETETDNANE